MISTAFPLAVSISNRPMIMIYVCVEKPVRILRQVVNTNAAPLWPTANIGMRWNSRSGMPYTPITGNQPDLVYNGLYVPVYGELNSARADAYHRLDLRLERETHGSFYMDIISAYGATT